MKNFKKLFASLAIVAMLGTAVPTTVLGAASYSTELQGAYDYAYGIGVTTQSSIDTANMYGSLLRSHMAKMMVNYAKEVKGLTADTSKTCTFTDVANQTEEMQGYIKDACQMGLMGVGITAFNPNGTVTRAQFGTVLDRVLNGSVNDVNTNPYYAQHLQALKDAGVMTQISHPDQLEVRGYVMLMMQRADTGTGTTPAICQTPENVLSCSLGLDTCPAQCVTTPIITKAGSLNVSSISNGTTSVPMVGVSKAGTFTFSAGNEDVTLNGVTVTRQGLGNNSDVNKVYMTLNGARVSNLQSLGSDGTTMIYFSPALVVKANNSLNLNLMVKFSSSTSNGQHQFAITDSNKIDSSAATIGGNFPLSTSMMTTTNYTVDTGTFYVSSADNTLKLGNTAVEVGQFQINNADANKTLNFQSIMLRNNGTADLTKDLANIKVLRGGVPVSSNVSINGRNLTLSLNDTINGGLTATYSIVADIVNVDNAGGDTVQLQLQNVYDLNITEATTSFLASVVTDPSNTNNRGSSTTTTTTTAGMLRLYTLQGSDFTLTSDPATVASQNITAGQQNVELLSSLVTVKAPVQIQDFKTTFAGGVTNNYGAIFSNITLQINGVNVASVSPATTDVGTLSFLGTFNVNASGKIKVLGTVRSNLATSYNGNSYTLSLVNPWYTSIQYTSNGNNVNATVGTVGGNVLTVGGTSMTVTKNDGLSDSTIVASSNGTTVFGVMIQAGSNSSLTLNQLNLTNIGTTSSSLNSLATYTLYNGANPIANATQTAGAIKFQSLGALPIPAGQSINLIVKASLPTNVSGGLQLALSSGGIVGVDSLGNSLTPNFATINGALFTLTSNGTVAITQNTDAAIIANQGALAIAGGVATDVFAVNFSSTNDTAKLKDLYVVNAGTMALNSVQSTLTIGGQTINGVSYTSGLWFNLNNGSSINTTSDGAALVGKITLKLPAGILTGSYVANGIQLSVSTGTNVFDSNALTANGGSISDGVRAISSNGQSASVNGTATSYAHTYVPVFPLFAAVTNSNSMGILINGATNTFPITLTGLAINCTQNGTITFTINLKNGSNGMVSNYTLTGGTTTRLPITGYNTFTSNATLTLTAIAASQTTNGSNGTKTCTISDAHYTDGVSAKTASAYVNEGLSAGGISASFN